jgi:HK97 family phage portal protein
MRFGEALAAKASGALTKLTQIAKRPSSLAFVEAVQANLFAPPSSDAATMLKLYTESPWVRTILHKISGSVGKQAWYVESEGNDQRIDKHPALEFIKAGSKKLRGKQAMALTSTYIDLTGEAFWGIGRDARGKAAEYAVIPPHWVISIPTVVDAFYRIQPRMGVQFEIPEDQILHFRDVDPSEPYGRGKGLVHAMSVELDTDKEASRFLNSFFKNRARPDIIISGTETAPLSTADVGRAEMSWRERHQGSAKVGRPWFTSREVKVQEVGFGLRENQIDKIREGQKKIISELWGIPPEILGRLDSSNRATIDSADYLFSKHVVLPRLEFIRDVLEPWAALEFGIEPEALQFENPVAREITNTLLIMQARPGAFTDNEFRELADFDRLNGDEYDKPRPDPFAPDPMDPNAEPPGGGKKPDDGKDEAPPQDTPSKSCVADAAVGLCAATSGAEAKAEVPAQAKSLTPADIVSVSGALADPLVQAQASKIFDDLFQKLLRQYGDELLGELDSSVQYQINTAVADWINGRSSSLVSQTDRTTMDALKAALVDGAAADEGYDALVSRIDDLFAQAADFRAELIGQTEATALTGFGTLSAAKQGGFEEKQWLTTQDQLVRDSHKALNGKIVPVDASFETETGASAQFPGDFGDAAEDINCRCAIRPVLPGEEKALGKPGYAKWHDKARERIVTNVRKKSAIIFSAQREVVIAQLKRSMGHYAI